jgi:hypothetical protein
MDKKSSELVKSAAVCAELGTMPREYKRNAAIFQTVFGDVHSSEAPFTYQNGTHSPQALGAWISSDKPSNRI